MPISTKTMTDQKPLEGIRVLDLTHQVAGPYCTMLLGDMGADVIKVEPPNSSEEGRQYPFFGISVYLAFNRNKRSIVIDAKTKEGRQILHKLAEQSDIFVENFSPGVTAKLGVDYATLAKINPRLIYCSISGFGSTGPYKNRTGWDPMVQAMSGIMSVTGEPGGNPVRCGVSLTDMSAGLYGAYAITLALIARTSSGKGQFVETSLYDTAVSFMTYWLTNYDLTGRMPVKVGSGWPPFCPYQVFKTSDGMVFIGVNNESSWNSFLKVLDLQTLGDDDRFKTNALRVSNKKELLPLIEPVIALRKQKELIELLAAAGVAAGPLNEIDKVITDPQLNDRGLIAEMSYEKIPSYKTVGIPFKMSETPGALSLNPPEPGNATDAVLESLGYVAKDVNEFRQRGIVK